MSKHSRMPQEKLKENCLADNVTEYISYDKLPRQYQPLLMEYIAYQITKLVAQFLYTRESTKINGTNKK